MHRMVVQQCKQTWLVMYIAGKPLSTVKWAAAANTVLIFLASVYDMLS